MRKLWNGRILLIAALALLSWAAFFNDALGSFASLQRHGNFGAYQAEMFYLYGDTLEAEELAKFDIPGRMAEAVAEMDVVIAREPIFAEHGVKDFAGYQELKRLASSDIPYEEADGLWAVINEMSPRLEEWKDGITLDEWYDSPLMRYDCLTYLQNHYVYPGSFLLPIIEKSPSPLIVRAAERLLAAGNNNLISAYLCRIFSLYAAITALFAVTAVVLLTLPLISVDRARKIHLLQYTARTGRKILARQLAAMGVSAFLLSALLIAASYAPFLLSGGAGDYWRARIMTCDGWFLWLHNITFGQYVLLLAGMTAVLCAGAACAAFLLARFSDGLVALRLKAVPVCAALGAVAVLALNMALSDNNLIFLKVFAARFHAPEVIVCGAAAIIGAAASVIVLKREKRAEL
jgi:hypothetical protein